MPSIIYGMFSFCLSLRPCLPITFRCPCKNCWALMPLWVPVWRQHQRFGILAAGIVLAFMVLPFVAAVMRDVLRSSILRESAYGLGAPWRGGSSRGAAFIRRRALWEESCWPLAVALGKPWR